VRRLLTWPARYLDITNDNVTNEPAVPASGANATNV